MVLQYKKLYFGKIPNLYILYLFKIVDSFR